MSGHGIPTLYNGIHFRSRAEARWAAFFDFVGWAWDYEPVELDGYIPDFVLRWYKPLLVEVKGGAIDLRDLEDHKAKIEESGWEQRALLVTATPERGGAVGLLGVADRKGWVWRRALPYLCSDKPSIHFDGLKWCQRCGVMHEGAPWSPTRDWMDACNATQWMPTARPV